VENRTSALVAVNERRLTGAGDLKVA